MDKELIKIADFLHSSKAQLTLRPGALNGKRADYFKGKHACNALMRPAYQSQSCLPVESMEQAHQILSQLLSNGMILRIDKQHKSKLLQFTQDQRFDLDSYYVWTYVPKNWGGTLLGVFVLAVVFIGVLFPLWPPFMRQGAYYVSMLMLTLLGLLMALGVFRWILWIFLVIVHGRGGWLFPRLFADVGVIESFYPVWVYLL